MKAEFLDEPELEFGHGGRHVDIRFGLMSFGPLDVGSPRRPQDISVAIIGTGETIDGMSRWFEVCRKELPAKDSPRPNLFPRFPGFDKTTPFQAKLALDPTLQGRIHQRDLDRVIAGPTDRLIADSVELFLGEARRLIEKARCDVVVCAPPAQLMDAVDPLASGRIPGQEEPDADESSTPLPPVAFHDVLKARGMPLGVPIQMIRPSTYGGRARRRRHQGSSRPDAVQDPATRAWNVHTALYYKAGGVPWRLQRDPSALTTCYVGISFYKSADGERLLTSMAQVFDERGDGVIVRGGPAEVHKDDRQAHLEQGAIQSLITHALKAYRGEHRTAPARILVHKTSLFNADEIAGCVSAASDAAIDTLELLTVRSGQIRAFRTGVYPPLRGTFITLDEQQQLLYTRGSVAFFSAYPGLYVPHPLDLLPAAIESPPIQLAAEILALSKMNWNNTQFDGGWPITLRAAKQVAAILRQCSDEAAVQARYAYYM